MKLDTINKISNAIMGVFFDPSLKMVVVHFQNTNKKDLVAYLKPDMSWDLRVILEDKSQLFEDKEVVEVLHEKIDTYSKGSSFDIMLRRSLDDVMKHSLDERLDLVRIILQNNSYKMSEN